MNYGTEGVINTSCEIPECIPPFSGQMFPPGAMPHPGLRYDAGAITYEPGNPDDWASPLPVDVREALDRLAAKLADETGAPIP